MPDYEIRFSVPEELDNLISIDGYRKKYVTEKVTQFLREILSNEMLNTIERGALDINPEIVKIGEEQPDGSIK